MVSGRPDFSIVILTYNREKYIRRQVENFNRLDGCEVIIVDNHSDDPYVERVQAEYPNVNVIRLEENYGAVGRSFGMEAATGHYVVTLDDDVWGITNSDLEHLAAMFRKEPNVAAICFKVIDDKTESICNWSHHKDPARFGEDTFETREISEGAVVFRNDVLRAVGFYPLPFFISHEGPDLAFRILNHHRKILYYPDVVVRHAHAQEGRMSWRRYYYDTRNLIWLAYRHYNARMWLKQFSLQMAAMLVYSTRDGYLKYYVKGILDAFRGLSQFKGTRSPVTAEVYRRIRDIDRDKPSLIYYIKRRIFKKGVGI